MLPGGNIRFKQYQITNHVMERYTERSGKPVEQLFEDLEVAVLSDHKVNNPEKEYALEAGGMVLICRIARGYHLIKTAINAKRRKKK